MHRVRDETGTNELVDLIYESVKETRSAFTALKQSEQKKKGA